MGKNMQNNKPWRKRKMYAALYGCCALKRPMVKYIAMRNASFDLWWKKRRDIGIATDVHLHRAYIDNAI